ncbi:MAG: ADP-ribosylation factor-like protein [Candidatus Helarchaeota archaeon]
MPSRTVSGELYFKIVYYGPELAGKTTSIKWIHEKEEGIRTGNLTSVKGGKDAGFFDRMSAQIGKLKFQVWSVAGRSKGLQSLRKVILEGCDGLIFVWDVHKDTWKENLASINELISILKGKLIEMPIIVMVNKMDLADQDIVDRKSIEKIFKKAKLNHAQFVETVAISGENVKQAFTACAKAILTAYSEQKQKPNKN